MLNAFHSNWTAPFFKLKPGEKYYIEDFEILTTMLSALKWRENNGNIKMVTDEVAAEFYKKINIESIWNRGMEIKLDNIIDKNIDANVFWAASKIFALKEEKAPCAMIDTDFIVWKNVKHLINNNDISVIHKENISKEVYPGKEYFQMKESYSFDERFDWTIKPCNTAFTVILNEEFKDYYTKESIKYMEAVDKGNDRLTNMVFAEQRLISMCAKKMNIEINEILSLDNLGANKQKYFTHTWGYKDVMRKDYNQRKEFCTRCIRRIIKDYPECEDIIANMKQLENYYKEVMLE